MWIDHNHKFFNAKIVDYPCDGFPAFLFRNIVLINNLFKDFINCSRAVNKRPYVRGRCVESIRFQVFEIHDKCFITKESCGYVI